MIRFSQYIKAVAISVVMLGASWAVDAQTLRILPFGNSITEGTDGDPPQESLRIAYRHTLYTLLTAAGYDFDFVGHQTGGYGVFPDAEHGGIAGTRDQYLVRLLQDGYDLRWEEQITPGSQPYLDVYPADLILLHIGTNDITHGEGASEGSVTQILNEIDAWELRTGNQVIVLVARILNRKEYSLITTQYNNNVAAMVAARNDPSIIMVDIENGAGINYPTEMQDDLIHPLPSAYTKMGQKWFEAIQALNTAPYFTSSPVTEAMEDVAYSYTITAEDDNPQDQLTLIAGTKPSWCTFTDNGDKTALLAGTPGDGDLGDHAVSIIVSDGKEIETQNFTIRVDNVNDIPRITGQRGIETDEDTPYTLVKEDFTIVDDDNPMSELNLIVLGGENYSVVGNTLSTAENYYGTLKVRVQVSDQVDTSDIYEATVIVNSVNDPPVISGQKSTLQAKKLISLEIQADDLYYQDVDNNLNQLQVVILPDERSLYLGNGNRLTIVVDTSGVIEVPVVLDDGSDISNEFALQILVIAAYNPPLFTTIPPKEAMAGEPYFYLVDAADPDEGDELSFSASTLPSWLNFNEDMKLLGGNPSTEDTGTVWVGLEVTDGMFVTEQLYQLEVRLYTSFGVDSYIRNKQASEGLIDEIFPVPARNRLYVRALTSDELDIQIMNASGIVVISEHQDVHPDSAVEIDLEDLNPGIYVIRVSNGERADSRKIIIRK